jgi:hypothetical protein
MKFLDNDISPNFDIQYIIKCFCKIGSVQKKYFVTVKKDEISSEMKIFKPKKTKFRQK